MVSFDPERDARSMDARPNAARKDETARSISCRISVPVDACIIIEDPPQPAPATPERSNEPKTSQSFFS